jgi:hypothetical protein
VALDGGAVLSFSRQTLDISPARKVKHVWRPTARKRA